MPTSPWYIPFWVLRKMNLETSDEVLLMFVSPKYGNNISSLFILTLTQYISFLWLLVYSLAVFVKMVITHKQRVAQVATGTVNQNNNFVHQNKITDLYQFSEGHSWQMLCDTEYSAVSKECDAMFPS